MLPSALRYGQLILAYSTRFGPLPLTNVSTAASSLLSAFSPINKVHQLWYSWRV